MTSDNALGILITALLVALLVGAAFSALFRTRGASHAGVWPIFWVFFLPVFLASWAGAIWVTPVGPVAWGVYWVPILCVGLITALILASLSPRRPPSTPAEAERAKQQVQNSELAIGVLFWIALVVFALLVLGGLFTSRPALG